MPSPGKVKGNGWEREVSLYLTDLYNESFCRTPSSGAYTGGKNSHRKDTLSESQVRAFKSDIIPGPSFPKLNIEAKFYKDIAFHQMIQGSCKQLDLWISQLLTSADKCDINLLALKFNRKGSYIAFQSYHLTEFDPGASYLKYHNIEKDHGSWIVTGFENFWSHNKDMVKKLSS